MTIPPPQSSGTTSLGAPENLLSLLQTVIVYGSVPVTSKHVLFAVITIKLFYVLGFGFNVSFGCVAVFAQS